jgi:hypothetical protein
MGGACSFPDRYIVFKLGLSPSQHENAALLNVLKKGCWGWGVINITKDDPKHQAAEDLRPVFRSSFPPKTYFYFYRFSD